MEVNRNEMIFLCIYLLDIINIVGKMNMISNYYIYMRNKIKSIIINHSDNNLGEANGLLLAVPQQSEEEDAYLY